MLYLYVVYLYITFSLDDKLFPPEARWASFSHAHKHKLEKLVENSWMEFLICRICDWTCVFLHYSGSFLLVPYFLATTKRRSSESLGEIQLVLPWMKRARGCWIIYPRALLCSASKEGKIARKKFDYELSMEVLFCSIGLFESSAIFHEWKAISSPNEMRFCEWNEPTAAIEPPQIEGCHQPSFRERAKMKKANFMNEISIRLDVRKVRDENESPNEAQMKVTNFIECNSFQQCSRKWVLIQ